MPTLRLATSVLGLPQNGSSSDIRQDAVHIALTGLIYSSESGNDYQLHQVRPRPKLYSLDLVGVSYWLAANSLV
jgi:hypothetical protein